MDTYNLGFDRLTCCKNQTYYFPFSAPDEPNSSQCQQKPLLNDFMPNCISYHHEYNECYKCDEGYYVSDGICCKLEEMRDTDNDRQCIAINGYDDDCVKVNGGKCIECNDQNKLKEDGSCETVPDECSKENYDPDSDKCTDCKDDEYQTNDRCCPEGEYYDDVTNNQCEPITTVDHCQRLNDDDDKCILCDNEHYLIEDTENYCCKYGKHCPDKDTEVDGAVRNCSVYSQSSGDSCNSCKKGYALTKAANSDRTGTIDICLLMELEHCLVDELTKVTEDDVNYNGLNCILCDRQYFLDPEDINFNPTLKRIEHVALNLEENCIKWDNKYLIEDSTLHCLECDQDNFVENNSCTARTNTDNCVPPYKPDEDKCLYCIDGYWLNDNGVCVTHQLDVPSSITCMGTVEDTKDPQCNCFYYDNDNDKCIVCDREYWFVYSNEARDSYSCIDIRSFEGDDIEAEPPLSYPASIHTCEENHLCTEQFLNGLDPEINIWTSCHVCKSSDQIPFISLDLPENSQGDWTGIQKYTLENQ